MRRDGTRHDFLRCAVSIEAGLRHVLTVGFGTVATNVGDPGLRGAGPVIAVELPPRNSPTSLRRHAPGSA